MTFVEISSHVLVVQVSSRAQVLFDQGAKTSARNSVEQEIGARTDLCQGWRGPRTELAHVTYLYLESE